MPSAEDSIYEYAPLDHYSLRDRFLIRMGAFAGYWIMRLVGATLRFETEGWENYDAVTSEGRLPILSFWHDRMLLATFFFRSRGIVVMSSRSRDAEFMARTIRHFGFGAVRGSSSRGGVRGLAGMRRAMSAGKTTGFTADGPRGPRYVAKPGPIFLAKLTGNPVLPFMLEPRRCWTLRSWDRLQIPMPFTQAKLFIGSPIDVPKDADDAVIEAKVSEMQTALDALVERGHEWRSGRSVTDVSR